VATKKIPVQPALEKIPVTRIFNFPVKFKMAILFLVAFCFYANSFSNEYALDDEAVIQRNEYVQKGFPGIGKILSTDAYDSYYKETNSNQHLSGGRYRPLSIVLFAIEHQLWGESPKARHFVNVFLYVLCVLVIFYFLRNYLFRKTPYGEDTAFIASLLFAMHPLHTEVVANIKSSDEILSLLFIMLTFIFSIRYNETKKTVTLGAALLCFFLALSAKEYGLTLLFLLPLLFWLYFKQNLGRSITYSLPYYGIIFLYFLIRIAFIGFPHQHKELDILNNPYLFATPTQKIASEVFILGKYLWMLVCPYPLASDYGFAQIPYHGFSSPLVWLSILIYTAIICWGIKLLGKKDILAFPVFFFLLNLFMVSNFFINIGTTMGERLIFHSSLGFVTVISFGIVNATKILSIRRRSFVIMIFLGILVVLCGMETINRNKDWKNNFTLFTKDVKTIPNSVKANDDAGAQYINLSETIKDTLQSDSVAHIGLTYLYRAVHLDDSDVSGYLNLGIAYCKLIEPDSAKYFWDIAKRIYSGEPHLPGYYSLLGQIFTYTGNQLAKHGKYLQSVHEFESGIQCAPLNPDLWVNLGGTFFNTHQYDSARYAWLKALQINPNYPNLNQYLGMLPKPDQPSNSSPGFK
jgi:protein O-mannosyl-transferase